MSEERVRIFDTTLRDGEQSPGATLDTQDKVEIALQLARLGVDIIEAGFPAASPGDLEAVAKVAQAVGGEDGPIVAGLARAKESDINAAWEAVQHAKKPRIHTFIATSDIHLEFKLRMSREEVMKRMTEMVRHARSLCDDIQFSPEDASRTDPGFMYEVLSAAIEAGATTLNIPDTVGYANPPEWAEFIRGIRENVSNIDQAIISVHCHDDLGLATANTLAGIRAGARQAEVTINGIGERAGNASLEEVVMALQTRRDVYGLRTNIDSTQLARTSHLVSGRTGITVPPNKAIVGANAFAHEAGIHQDGMLKHQLTYEIMRPESVGVSQSKLVLGKHSGRHAFRERCVEMGFDHLTEDDIDRAFDRFKRLADRKKHVTEADLEALLSDEFYRPTDVFILHGVHVSCGSPSIPTASISLAGPDGHFETSTATGNGPVDSIFTAINKLTRLDIELEEYLVHAVSGGVDALGEVTVRVRTIDDDPRTYTGHGADTDVLVASAKAYIGAMNKVAIAKGISPPELSETETEATAG
jgi:2-isopropylmalate synthase